MIRKHFTPPDYLNGPVMKVSKELAVAADSANFGRRSPFRIGPAQNVYRLITDACAPEDFPAALRKKGVEVALV
jgi:DeoR/GlpR family transcriptional regulator of sugar metabolism